MLSVYVVYGTTKSLRKSMLKMSVICIFVLCLSAALHAEHLYADVTDTNNISTGNNTTIKASGTQTDSKLAEHFFHGYKVGVVTTIIAIPTVICAAISISVVTLIALIVAKKQFRKIPPGPTAAELAEVTRRLYPTAAGISETLPQP